MPRTLPAGRASLISGLFSLALLTSCGAAEPTSSPAPEPAAGGGDASGHPVTVDNCGVEVTFSEAPERVVAIKSTPIELLLALGLEDRVVGTAFSDGPVPEEWTTAAAALPVISDKVPSQEATLELEPDLVFAGWESNLTAEGAGDRELLARLGINTYVAPSACQGEGYQPQPMTFDLLFSHITELGAIFDVPDRAAALVREQRDALAAVVPSDAGLSALWYSSGNDVPYVGAGIGAPNMILEAAGLTNIAADVADTWTSMGWEAVAAADPDVIVLVDAAWNTAESKVEMLRDNPVTAALPAVREERFVVVPFPASEAGVRNVDAVVSISEQLGELGL